MSPTFSTPVSGTINVIFLLADLRPSDNGLYTCQARSSSGQAVMSASLSVVTGRMEAGEAIEQPGLADVPGSPSKPHLVNATENSVEVEWDKPLRIGGSSLRGYQVRKLYQKCPITFLAPF